MGNNIENGKRKKINKDWYVKIIAFGAIILTCLVIHLLQPDFFYQIYKLSTEGNLENIIVFLKSYGIYAIIVSLLIDIFINALGFLPSIFISTANGLLFGLPIGILVSWIAETIGVIISFIIMRYFLKESAEKLIENNKFLNNINNKSDENGFKFMLIARMLPYFPSGILTAIGAVSKISFRDYVIANLIGKFPSTALEVILGHDLVNFGENKLRLSIIITLLLLIYFWYLWKNKKKKKN
jgi:uncharacterized membrane protein YdjX (TVP38/TMEM64 family)